MTGRLFTLASFSVGAAGTQNIEQVIDLAGVSAISFEAVFAYGTGGTTCIAKIQTSFDGGTLWRDIARIDFAQANRTVHFNIEALAAKAIAAYADLSAEGLVHGVLGDRLRAQIISTGTYANTAGIIRASTRG